LYDEAELEERAEFSDPEIRRSSLAGVILRMKSLGLPEIDEFPFLDAPSPKAVAEGYRTLREVGALDRDRKLTAYGREMARMPVDPRLARMIIEARKEHCLAEILPIIGFLESNDPRERPAEKAREADEAHAIWKDAESDFIGILRMWNDLQKFRDERGAWRRNALRKFCVSTYLNMRRVIEWANVVDELAEGTSIELKRENGKHSASENTYPYAAIHRSLLAGVPQQFGLWDRDNKAYRSASGGLFAVFPGSGLFAAPKRWEWVVAMELVETSRLWARRVARIDPDWVEQVAPHLCRSVYGEARWDEAQGAVYGKERVVCGGLAVVNGRRVHYGRVDAKLAHAVFVREGLLGGGLRKRAKFLEFIDELRDEVGAIEDKLRRPGGVWDEDALMLYCEEQIPHEINTAAAFHKWLAPHEEKLIDGLRAMVDEQLQCHGVDGYPDEIFHEGDSYPIYYRTAPGERDDGVTIGVHVDQLPSLPEWLPAWGVDGHLRERVELILRSLPKDYRRACQPIASLADAFVELWALAPKDGPLAQVLSDFIRVRTGADVPVDAYDFSRLPDHLITKIWVCDDEGEELALGTAVAELKLRLGDRMRIRFEAAASADLERSGMSSWDGEKLPERVPIPGGFAYPALVDEQSSVGVRAFVNDHEARESHRAGGARLLCLAHAGEVDHLRKKFPIGLMTKVELPRLGDGGTSIDDLLILTAEGVVGGIFPRSPDGFRELGKSCRGHWFDAAKLLSAALDEIVEAASGISAWIDEHRADRNLGVVAADIHEQLGWLFRERFAWRAGYARLLDYPRRLKAIRSRLGRIKSLPLAKDLEKMQRVRRLWEPWHARWKKDPLNPAHWEVGFILEDWRVAVFAPDLPSPTKVSEKKIEEMLGAAG
jgi:ATP-dependent helicase HrpA